jgi:prepilin-type N-terminal cleavage/methylation domain-containing protein
MICRPLTTAKFHIVRFFAVNRRLHEYFSKTGRKGFTLVELAVVIVIIGVLAAFGVPRFMNAVEKAKAAEAFAYLAAIRDAQERYQAQNGTYATDLTALDIQIPAPTYFSVGTVVAGATSNLQSSWSLTMTRSGASAGYAAYTVVFTDQGFNVSSTIPAAICPVALPASS